MLFRSASIVLNELVLDESANYLEKYGKTYSVRSAEKHLLLKKGECYNNAGNKISEGYGYAEGYIRHKDIGLKTAHAWNIHKDGSHIDFTLDNSSDYEYFGAIIPNKEVYLTGLKNGGIWYCVIPYLSHDSEQGIKE